MVHSQTRYYTSLMVDHMVHRKRMYDTRSVDRSGAWRLVGHGDPCGEVVVVVVVVVTILVIMY